MNFTKYAIVSLILFMVSSLSHGYAFTDCSGKPTKRQSGNMTIGYYQSYEGGVWHRAMEEVAFAFNQNPSKAQVIISNPEDSEKIYFVNSSNVPGWQTGALAMEAGIHECWKNFKDLKLTWERDIRNVRIMFDNKAICNPRLETYFLS